MDIITFNEVKKIYREIVNIKRYKKVQELITDSKTWNAPKGIKNNQVEITMIGGGASGGKYKVGSFYFGGGGSGVFVKNRLINLNDTKTVNVTIGKGGADRKSRGKGNKGSLSSFGSIVTVQGGEPGEADTYNDSKGGYGGNRGEKGGYEANDGYASNGKGGEGLDIAFMPDKIKNNNAAKFGEGGYSTYDVNTSNNAGRDGCCLIEYEVEVA